MTLTSMPYLTIQELDANGNPYAGAKLFFYEAGTTTKRNTYADADGSTANANPVVLDAAGRATVFFLPFVAYDVVLAPSTDTDPPTSPYWERPGILPVSAADARLMVTGTAGENLSAGDAVFLSDGQGGLTTGRWYKTDSDAEHSSLGAPQFGMIEDAIAVSATGNIIVAGRVTGLSGMGSGGALKYISSTAGAIAAVSGAAYIQPVAVSDGLDGGTSVILNPHTDVGLMRFAQIVADADITSSTTLTSIPTMTFPVVALRKYIFSMRLMFISNATADIKFALIGPVAPTVVWYGIDPYSVTAGAATSFGTAIDVPCGAVLSSCILSGYIEVGSAGGPIYLQFAQKTSDAVTTSVKAYSYLTFTRVLTS